MSENEAKTARDLRLGSPPPQPKVLLRPEENETTEDRSGEISISKNWGIFS